MNKAPIRPDSRNKVYDIIDGEIEYAVETHPQSPILTITEYVALIDSFAVKLATPFVPESPSAPHLTVDEEAARAKTARGIFREIAALSIRAMEAYGAVPRENHVPASAGITGTLNIVMKGDATSAPKAAVANALVHTGPKSKSFAV